MLYGADVVSVFHYSRIVIADAFRSGRLPVWDPHVMAGFPLLAGVQGAVFYPPTWFCVLMSAGTFWTLSAWAHLILAGVFAHRWLERGLGLNPWSALAGACAFMISGYISGHVLAGHVNYVWAYPWIPALLWRLERFLAGATLKRGVLLALVLAMLFLAGVPQYLFFSGLLAFVRLIHFIFISLENRRVRAFRAGQAVAWLALGFMFCAPQLFPTLELIGQMHRGAGSSTSYFVEYSMKPAQLGDLIFAPARAFVGERDWSSEFGDMKSYRYDAWWETCGFVGGAVLVLTLAIHAGRHAQRHLWSGIAILAIILSFGDSNFFYQGFVAVVPGAGWFRGPGRYLLLFTVGMAALAAIGFEALWKRGPNALRFLAVLLAVAVVVQLFDFGRPCFQKHPLNDVFKGKVEESPYELLELRPRLRALLQERCGETGRVANGRPEVLLIGQCQAAGLDHVGGYEPMMLRRYAEAINAARGTATDVEMVVVASVAPHPVISMLATRVLLTSRGILDYPDPLPRTWVVNNAVVIEDKAERLRTIGFGKWDPRRTVILESYPTDAPPVPTETPAGRSKVLARKPGYYEIEAENTADAYLVLSEAYYPGWTAVVDGRPAEVLPADHLIQTVRLPAGKHLVRFQYHSRFLSLGFAVAALAALVPVGLLVRRHRRQLALQRLPGAP